MSQHFQPVDIPILFILFILEALLSLDNSVALAMITKTLPEKQQKQALFIGIFSNFIFRAFVIFFAYFLLEIPAIQIIGGVYLLYLSLSHIFVRNKTNSAKKSRFWVSVIKIECLDFIFALDSILSAFSLLALFYAPSVLPSKFWMVYVAGIFGMVKIRLLSSWMTKLIQKHAFLEQLSHLIIGWLGIKLVFMALEHVFNWSLNNTIVDWLFWIGLFAIITIYWTLYRRRKHS